jgi:hypothetical protein
MTKRLMVLLGMVALVLATAVPAAFAQDGAQYGQQYAQGQGPVTPTGVLGTITSISGSAVLVEEDPSTAGSGEKGYFTVTEETEISRLVGGDAVAPASFEDLAVGQPVEATYAGPVAESYPTQGNAASIVILGEDAGEEETATLSFELTVEGEPPAGTTFSGLASLESLLTTPLTDPDGDGLYTGSLVVPATGAGQGGPPEPLSLPVQIVQDGAAVIKDFGTVTIDGDKTFEASVSFGDGGENPGSNNPGNGNDTDPGDGSGSGGTMGTLPETGGFAPLAAAAGALLVVAGLVARRVLER